MTPDDSSLDSDLLQKALSLKEGVISPEGAFMVHTGTQHGRATLERFIVLDNTTKSSVDWGIINQALDASLSERLFQVASERLAAMKSFHFSGYVGPFKLHFQSSSAWHTAFAHNMFRKVPAQAQGAKLDKAKTLEIYHLPKMRAQDLGVELGQWSMPSGVLLVLDPSAWRLLVVGTEYAGEIKKGAFSLCNYWLPEFGMLPMHASANCEAQGQNSSVLFGLSGTGKTTLSASPDRYLVGDDEIIWNPNGGLFNLEGGCYAKLIDLDPNKEPDIFRAVNRPGSILENVVFHSATKIPNFLDRSLTENTRGSYRLSVLPKVFNQNAESAPPQSIVFLTADAFGALPAVARLNADQAQYHFLSGYTAKVAGTEMGVKEPKAVFSACFGAPFMPRPPRVYAEMLAHFAQNSKASVWLLNTGWTGGSYAEGAKRFPLEVSRKLLNLIQNGQLNHSKMKKHPVFGFDVPESVPGVDQKYLHIPEGDSVKKLANLFYENAKKTLGPESQDLIQKGGPNLESF